MSGIKVGDRVRAKMDVTGTVAHIWRDEPDTYTLNLDRGQSVEIWLGDETCPGFDVTLLEGVQPSDRSVILLAEGVAAQRHGDVWRVVNGAEYAWAYILKRHGPVKVVSDGE